MFCGFLSVFVTVIIERTQESAIEFIELYRRKEITWDPKHPVHCNKIKRQDAWEELGKEMKRPVDECKKTGEMKVSERSGTGNGGYF